MIFDALKVARKDGSEAFHTTGTSMGFDILSFWQWAFSDLCSNALRGVLAEYLVAQAVGATVGVRNEWEAWDVVTEQDTRVEVKASAYIQTWGQEKLSRISFDIEPKKARDAAGNVSPIRWANVYVFALLFHQEKATVDPLDVSQWTFLVLPTSVLDAKCPTQKGIALSSLLKLGPVEVGFEGLGEAIKSAGKDR